MKYEKKRLEFLAKSGYLKKCAHLSADEYEKLNEEEKKKCIKIEGELIAGGRNIEYVKYAEVDSNISDNQLNNIILFEMYDKITKCEKNVKIITVIMIIFAIIAAIGIIGSISAINSINEAINSFIGGLDSLY